MMVEVTYQTVLSTLQTAGILVGIIYYLTIMRNSQKNQQMQLDTRQAQFFMQSYSQTYSPIHQENIIEVLDWDWTDYDDFIDRFYNDNRKKAVWNSVMLVYDGFNVLRNEDFIDAKLLYEMSQCGTKGATLVWFRYMPVIVEMRVRDNNPCMLRNLEGHVKEMVRLRKMNGLPSVWSEEQKFFTSK